MAKIAKAIPACVARANADSFSKADKAKATQIGNAVEKAARAFQTADSNRALVAFNQGRANPGLTEQQRAAIRADFKGRGLAGASLLAAIVFNASSNPKLAAPKPDQGLRAYYDALPKATSGQGARGGRPRGSDAKGKAKAGPDADATGNAPKAPGKHGAVTVASHMTPAGMFLALAKNETDAAILTRVHASGSAWGKLVAFAKELDDAARAKADALKAAKADKAPAKRRKLTLPTA